LEIQAGERVWLSLDLPRMHFFESEKGKNLLPS